MKTKICSKCHKRKKLFEFYEENRIKDGFRSWCKNCVKEYTKKYQQTHKKQIKNYYQKNKEKLLKYNKEYRLNNKEKLKENKKIYSRENREKITKSHRIWERKERKNNIQFKILKNLRRRINRSLKGNPKLSTTMKLVGCSLKKLKQYLEAQFKPDMNWENYGYYGWHIDHIKPCASFDLNKISEQRKCFYYTNLQPLWAEENLRKNDKIMEVTK